MVSATRLTSRLREDSREELPGVPVKYFWATMFMAFKLQPSGKSTPFCSKTGLPNVGLVIIESRLTHRSWSYALDFGLVKSRRTDSLVACAIVFTLLWPPKLLKKFVRLKPANFG